MFFRLLPAGESQINNSHCPGPSIQSETCEHLAVMYGQHLFRIPSPCKKINMRFTPAMRYTHTPAPGHQGKRSDSFVQDVIDPSQNIVFVPHPCHRPMVPTNSELQTSPCTVGRQPKLQPQESIQSDSTAITTRLAMNIETGARAFQNPFQSRKDIKIVLTGRFVVDAPINVLDVSRTSMPSQSIATVPQASRGIKGAHTVEHMRHSTPTQPCHIQSRTQATPTQRTREQLRQTHFRQRHLTIMVFVPVYNPRFYNSKRLMRSMAPQIRLLGCQMALHLGNA